MERLGNYDSGNGDEYHQNSSLSVKLERISSTILQGYTETPTEISYQNENSSILFDHMIESNQGIKKEMVFEETEHDFNNTSSMLNVEIATDLQILHTKLEIIEEPLRRNTIESSSSVEEVKNIFIQSNKHIQEENEERKYICEVCTKPFKCKQHLKIHSVVHTDLKLFPCHECIKAFKLKCQLVDHLKIHSDLKPFACDLCGKSFRLKHQLVVHNISHSEDRPFECDICGKTFKLKNSLQTHELVHSEIKAFNCEVCGKAFKLKQQLQSHQLTHSDSKPYECDICGKSFKMKHQVQNHKKSHSNERPFECEMCNKSFKFKQTLKVHYKVHSAHSTQYKKSIKVELMDLYE